MNLANVLSSIEKSDSNMEVGFDLADKLMLSLEAVQKQKLDEHRCTQPGYYHITKIFLVCTNVYHTVYVCVYVCMYYIYHVCMYCM